MRVLIFCSILCTVFNNVRASNQSLLGKSFLCTQEAATSISLDYDSSLFGDKNKKVFDSTSEVRRDDKNKFTIKFKKGYATLIGNGGEVILKGQNETFVESNLMGDLFFYRIFRNKKGLTIIQMKAYDLAGPASFSTAYSCI